jgi:hypothetical protein
VGRSDALKSGRPQHAREGGSPLITSSSRYKRLKASRAFSASACVPVITETLAGLAVLHREPVIANRADRKTRFGHVSDFVFDAF